MEKSSLNLSLYTRVTLSFLVFVVLLALSISISLWQFSKVSAITTELVTVKMPMVQSSLELLSGVNQASASLRGWIINPNKKYKDSLDEAWEEKIPQALSKLNKVAQKTGNSGEMAIYKAINTSMNQLQLAQYEIINLFATDKNKAMVLFNKQVDEFSLPMRNKLESMISLQNKHMMNAALNAEKSFYFLNIFEWSVLILGSIFGVFLSRRLAKGISNPVRNMAIAAEAIAKGELDKPVNIEGSREIQELSRSINKIMDTMRNITSNAKKISQGDFQQSLTPRSSDDDLIVALNDMTATLAENKQFYEEQAWLQKGSSQILLCVANNPELKQLCSESLSEICRYLDAGIGALYLFDESTEELSLTATFAYKERNFLSNQFKLGEGIIGQVGLERQPILLKNIRREDLVISTGVSEEPPLTTFTFPLIDKSNLVGVVELAFHDHLSPSKIKYIENITPLMSGNIRICEQKEVTERLLESQKTLTEELQVQQEELKAANEELESQTEELKSSEEELRVNEEEQRTLNQALEERNKLLQEQTSSLKQAQSELMEQTTRISQASKYKSEFLANMSHELRTPLNSLLILSKLLSENKENNLNEEQVDSLCVIHRSGMELLQLINDVLDLAKVEAGKLKLEASEVFVGDFVDLLHDDFQGLAQEKKLDFKIDVKEDAVKTIVTDAQRLKQILKNLLSNAFKFTEQGGVTLEVHIPKDEYQFKSANLNQNNCLGFSIRDTGIGIPKEKHDQIFETFFQGDGALNRKYNGTGLGLSISAQLTELLQGEIKITSNENQGSTFTLYIPIRLDRDLPESNQQETIPEKLKEKVLTIDVTPNAKKNKSLLIIEDDVQFAKILADVCVKKGYQCKHAISGKEGYQIAVKELPACIFLDINLPDMSGLTLADQLKTNTSTKNIPIHFISGSDKGDEAMQHGAASYLMKPITIEKLDLAIDSVSHSINDKVSRLLIVEDDDVLRVQIQKSYEEKNIKVFEAANGQEALNLLKSEHIDCMILDLGLPDISGFELLKTIDKNKEYAHPAVVVYTGKEFSEEDHMQLQDYSKNIIIKGKASLERLLDESALFLHQVEKKGVLSSDDASSNLEIKEQLQGKKILLVDDDMRNTFSLAKLMNNMGVHTAIASNGKIAIDMLLKENDFDGVLMDIMMPVMDGFETIEKIRTMNNFKNLPIIALTAKAMSNDREKCLQLGATDYLAKPLDVDKLIILMRAYLCQ